MDLLFEKSSVSTLTRLIDSNREWLVVAFTSSGDAPFTWLYCVEAVLCLLGFLAACHCTHFLQGSLYSTFCRFSIHLSSKNTNAVYLI